MNLSKTKVMLNENVITSTVAVDGDIIEKVDRYVYLGKTVTQAGDLLHEIKRRIARGWAIFNKVANIMKSRIRIRNVFIQFSQKCIQSKNGKIWDQGTLQPGR